MSDKQVFVTRKMHFNGAHKLYNPSWTEEKNEEVFGRCANKNWHGHNFDLYVTVKGVPRPDTGFVMDLKKLKIILKDRVVSKLDHQNFNLDVEIIISSCNKLPGSKTEQDIPIFSLNHKFKWGCLKKV